MPLCSLRQEQWVVHVQLTVASTLSTTLVTRVGKKSFYTHFAPPHTYAMLTKHFHLTQVCILPFSNIERGNGGVDTYSVDITIIMSRFWHFPTLVLMILFVQYIGYLPARRSVWWPRNANKKFTYFVEYENSDNLGQIVLENAKNMKL